ncbi:uncharacterized protein LOC123895611 [Trifolium pratense]|uniref:uncharacterized protein LOC123895611 n=1 Tax=Trifolium pratense TaxID=57577 RepID=UPI001E6980AA|nr:uncharacterized protein LOC123895611 [Trifolium pratense]
MNVIFSYQDVEDLITTGYEPLAENATAAQQTTFREVKNKDNKALFLIHQCVDSSNFEKIVGAKTAKAAWDILSNAHGGGDKVKKRLKERKEKKDNKVNQEQALYAKNGGQWNKNGKGKNKWNKNKGKAEFINDHNGDQDQSESSKKDSFFKGKNGGKKSDKSKIQCYSCEKWGHCASECRSKGNKKQDNEAHHARHDESDFDGFLLMVTTNSKSDNSKLWYLDTGCSNHMTGHRDWLLEFDDNFKSKVKFADDSAISVEGKGKVMVQRKNGNHTFVTDVLFVPTMKHNMLSLGQLLEKGFNYSTKDHCIEVFDPQNKLIIKAPLSKNRTFKVNFQASEVQCFSSLITKDEKWL